VLEGMPMKPLAPAAQSATAIARITIAFKVRIA
jgi:hypothetical protein